MRLRIEAEVLKLRCTSCSTESPTLELSGEADYVTSGLGAATCLAGNEVALGKLTSSEYSDTENGHADFAKRLSIQLGRQFTSIPLAAAADTRLVVGKTFQQFVQSNERRKLTFVCPACRGEAVEFARESISGFVAAGGVITLLTDVELI